MNRQDLEKRIKEFENLIVQQGHTAQQINNQILMFHGAKEELVVWLAKLDAQEKMEQEKLEAAKKAEEEAAAKEANPATQDDLCGENADGELQGDAPNSEG